MHPTDSWKGRKGAGPEATSLEFLPGSASGSLCNLGHIALLLFPLPHCGCAYITSGILKLVSPTELALTELAYVLLAKQP